MGSSSSSAACESPGSDLQLPVTGISFTSQQLKSLNGYVDTLFQNDQRGRMPMETEYAVETLVQRLVDGAGQRDPRFKCCHLIALHRGKKMRSRSLEYLVTLDSLPVLNTESEDCIIQDGPVGYGKIRLGGREADKWNEFLTPTGYLCRDKVVERWVELIARCAQSRGGSASRALCARAHARTAPYTYCYLERVSQQTSVERRLAIVEGTAWVMVRIGAGEAEAKLMLGARVGGGSPATYTTRVPITHPLALLHYTSAQMEYYAVAAGPPSSIVCGERAATWQLWHPALEATLDAHYSELSTVAKIAGALNHLMDKMREGSYQGSAQLLSRYAAWCAAARRLHRCGQHRGAARGCLAAHRAHHLLLILDDLVQVCERESVAGFVYPVGRASLTRRGARGVQWLVDAAALKGCLLQLQARAEVNESLPPSPSECLEMALFSRWEALGREGSSRERGPASFSRRQLNYLRRLVHELVTCKETQNKEEQSTFRINLLQVTSVHQEAAEELIHILAIMLDQARDQYLNNMYTRSAADYDKELSSYRSKKWNKLKDYYDASSTCLIDAVRRHPELQTEDLNDQITLMKSVLQWLYKGAKEDKKYLGPVLKPFLDDLYMTSQENSWFLDEFDARKCLNEFSGLREYCMGVHNGGVEPCMGLLEAAKKYAWAKAMVDLVDKYKHTDFRLIFPTGEGLAVSYSVRLPSRREHRAARVLTLSRRDKAEAKVRLARRCVVSAFHAALVGSRCRGKRISRNESTEEILASVKLGNYWRNSTKPDIIPSQSESPELPRLRRRSRRSRPATTYGYPEISIVNQSDSKTIRKKYHTLKNLVYTEPVESIKELKERPRSAGSTLRNKEPLSRPSILETLDFINSVKDSLCVEESATSDTEDLSWSPGDEWVVTHMAPLNLMATRSGTHCLHLMLGDLIEALIQRGKFTILQELCVWLGIGAGAGTEAGGREGALFALYRLARAVRARSTERATTWKLPQYAPGDDEAPQRYRTRPPDYVSGDEAPQPPPLPRRSRDPRINVQSSLCPPELCINKDNTKILPNQNCTGILNPIYDVKIPKDKFTVKRTKSLGRTFSSKNLGLEITKYNLSLGRGKRSNDVTAALAGTSGETGLDFRSNYFQRHETENIVGDSYRLSRITVD